MDDGSSIRSGDLVVRSQAIPRKFEGGEDEGDVELYFIFPNGLA